MSANPASPVWPKLALAAVPTAVLATALWFAPVSEPALRSVSCSNKLQADADLGFVLPPGTHTCTLRNRGLTRTFRAVIGPDGARRSADEPYREPLDPRPEVVLLGDSFGFGWGVDDSESMGWIAQSELPHLRLRNLSAPGYNNVHSLRWLRRLATQSRRPAAVVVLYRSDFLARNVGTPQWLAALGRSSGPDTAGYLRVRTTDQGLHEELVPLTEAGLRNAAAAPDSVAVQAKVTIALFEQMRELADSAGIPLWVALQQVDSGDPVVAWLSGSGISHWAISPPAALWQTLEPVDFHPGPVTQAWYGRALAKGLLERIPRSLHLPPK